MSYILDALRRADAERDRGNVPGIHAQPSFGGAPPNRATPSAKPWPWLAAGAIGALLIGGLTWYFIGPQRAETATTTVSAPAPVTPPVATAPPAAVAVAPPLVAAPPPVVAQAEPPRPPPEAVPRKPKPAPSTTADGANPPAAAKPASSSEEKVYAMAELPDDIRRQLPTLSIGGSMYSSKAADRILIINGQVMHEGDRIAPDLQLQQIRPRAAVLNFKGYRYSLAF